MPCLARLGSSDRPHQALISDLRSRLDRGSRPQFRPSSSADQTLVSDDAGADEGIGIRRGLRRAQCRLDKLIAEQATVGPWAPLIARLVACVGLKHPKHLASLIGLVPSENSSGERRRQGDHQERIQPRASAVDRSVLASSGCSPRCSKTDDLRTETNSRRRPAGSCGLRSSSCAGCQRGLGSPLRTVGPGRRR